MQSMRGHSPAFPTNEDAHYLLSSPVTAAPDRCINRQGASGESGTKPNVAGGRAGICFIFACAQIGVNLVVGG